MYCFEKLICFISFINWIVFCNSLQCKNERNDSVDWYVMYKLPHQNNNLATYMYIISDDVTEGWKLSDFSLNDTNSIPGLTLQPLYEGNTAMHILYNDQPPNRKNNEYLGHTKGVIMSNNTHGFWLIHSVPHYPPVDLYYYPESAMRYGQSFFCISFNIRNIDNIGKQLQYNQPFIYQSKISNSLINKLPNINAAINNDTVKSAPWNRLTSLYSIQNTSFLSFAKSGKFGKELYEDWIAVALQKNLVVESWLNGSGKLPSNCTNIYKVRNIKSIHLPYNVSFSSSKDHSKWTISELGSRNWICIGDINREERQKHRGGGVVCVANLKLWKAYNTSVAEIELCK